MASKSVRRVPIDDTDSVQGGGYKRYFNSYDISDYSWHGFTDGPDEKFGPDGKVTRDWRRWYISK